jgi:hypothetical protein
MVGYSLEELQQMKFQDITPENGIARKSILFRGKFKVYQLPLKRIH